MKLLLDTNVFIWASLEPGRLTAKARDILTVPYHARYVSAASLWEMQIKHMQGKLLLPGRVDQVGPAWMRPLVAQNLGVEVRHLGKLYELSPIHRDPFDLLLIAQALCDGMTIVSADPVLSQYKVPVIW